MHKINPGSLILARILNGVLLPSERVDLLALDDHALAGAAVELLKETKAAIRDGLAIRPLDASIAFRDDLRALRAKLTAEGQPVESDEAKEWKRLDSSLMASGSANSPRSAAPTA